MLCCKCLFLLCWLKTFCCFHNSSNQLYNDTFSDYNAIIRPVQDERDTLFVSFTFNLMGIVELNEIEQSFTLNGQFFFSWVDVSLQWDPSLYNGIWDIYPEQKNVWIPDIFLTNSMDSRKGLGFDDMKVRVLSNGLVYWPPGNVYKFSCPMDMTYFPYDTQRCQMSLSTWITPIEKINFMNVNFEFEETDFVPNGLWNLTTFDFKIDTADNVTDTADNVTYPIARIYLTFQRRPQYYVLNILVPVILLSAANVFVFFIPADSGEKMGLPITVLLAFVVFLTLLGNVLPANSLNTSYLILYITTQVVFSCFSLGATVVVLIIHHQHDTAPLPRCMTAFVYCMRCICWKTPCRGVRDYEANTSDVPNQASPESQEHPQHVDIISSSTCNEGNAIQQGKPVNWKDAARCLDIVFFILFALAETSLTIVLFLILIFKPNI